MFVLKPLAVRPIALLSSGQLLAAIGSELYRVALIWIAVDLAGAAGGYIVAAHSATILAVTLISGVWADRWDPRSTLISVHLLRVVTVLLLPLSAGIGGGVPTWLFWSVALTMAALTALFDPALQTSLPRLSPSVAMLPALNALIDAMRRLARILGPAMVGALAAFLPMVQFFSIVGLLFVLAAALTFAVGPIPHDPSPSLQTGWKRRVVDAAVAGWRATRPHRLLRFALPTMFVTTAAWCIAFYLGLALLVRELPGADASLYGLAVAAYGVGNFAANLVIGSIDLRRSGRIMYLGRLILGIGFTAMAFASSPLWLMAAAAVAAAGGPMGELPMLVRIQMDIPGPLVASVYRLRMIMDHAGILFGLLIAPSLLDLFGTTPVVALAGGVSIVAALVGLWLFANDVAPQTTDH
jgi:DHA3 family macrolide efflux protein-like MFS transporter